MRQFTALVQQQISGTHVQDYKDRIIDENQIWIIYDCVCRVSISNETLYGTILISVHSLLVRWHISET